jgi:peptidoglycan LD-endopeptidase LytH
MKVAARVVRVLILAFVASLLAPLAQPFVERAWFVYSLARQAPPAALPTPLRALRAPRFVDSWGNPRSGGRRHQGMDIFAPKDTPVLSTTSGLVTRVGTNGLGGQVVWILGPGLERHYYAHLNRYGTFRAGDRVDAGDVIGYAGNSGNARGGPVHLHYGIYRNGAAQNPYPRLALGATRGRLPEVLVSSRRLRALDHDDFETSLGRHQPQPPLFEDGGGQGRPRKLR